MRAVFKDKKTGKHYNLQELQELYNKTELPTGYGSTNYFMQNYEKVWGEWDNKVLKPAPKGSTALFGFGSRKDREL